MDEQTCRTWRLCNNPKKCSFLIFIDASLEETCSKAGDIYVWIDKDFWLSYKEHTVDALAPEGDEGRGNLR